MIETGEMYLYILVRMKKMNLDFEDFNFNVVQVRGKVVKRCKKIGLYWIIR